MKEGITPRTSAPPVREVPPHCATCEHWHGTPAQIGMGECRLFFPGPQGSPEAGNLRTGYPSTAATDFCSAHQSAADLD